MKDHEIRELVNQLRDVAIKYHGSGQLREQIARTVRAAILQAGTLIGEGTKLPPLKCLEIVKFNADCALSDPESIYASEFFLSLDEAFGEKGNYIEPVQAKAVSMLIGEVLRLHNYQTGSSPVIPGAEQRIADAVELLQKAAPAMLADNSGPDGPLAGRLKSPVIPEGYVMVPMRLTAENGAKGALSGEFSETKFVNCPECFGDDECETCDGSGRIEITEPVTWTTIKEIWAKGVEHFAAAPQEVSHG